MSVDNGIIKTTYPERGKLIISKTNIDFDEKSGVKTTTVVEREFNFSDLVVGKLPQTCHQCPCGYMDAVDGCGRRLPLDGQCRSPGCKLITFEEYLRKYNLN